MKPYFGLLMTSILLFLCFSCSEEDQNDNGLMSALDENEFVIKEDGAEMILIVNDCKYNELKSVEKDGMSLIVSKTFNSMMKLPCVLRYDTISLGSLSPGEYQLDYYLIDRNTFLEDSVFLHERRVLTVK